MRDHKLQIFQYVTNPVCAPYRFDFPANELNRRGHCRITRFCKFEKEIYRTLVEHADIIIFQRVPMSPAFAKICTSLQALAKWLVFEIDDDLLHLSPHSRFARLTPADYSQRIKKGIRACHSVQCSTQALASTIRNIHSEVVVLENQLDAVPAFQRRTKRERPIIIGYAAGEHHLHDWLTIKDEYNRVLTKLENEGHCLETWILGDEVIFDSITTKHKKFFPLTSRENYLRLLSKIDISLLPLADMMFNYSKSDAKFLESAASSCAVLASHIVYANSIEHGNTGLLYNTPEEFAKYLRRLVLDPKRIITLARKAHQYVSNHRLIRHHIECWEKTYLNWYSKKEERLQASMLQAQESAHLP